jgi:predicted RNA binding protein YcfA (HicA-like mRNA interferase family)
VAKGTDVPKTLNQKSAQKLLQSYGWSKTKGGKHNVKMEKAGERPITLPSHRGQEYSVDLTRAILKQAAII